jgi:hypothetical protein
LAISANTAIFTLVNAILLRQLRFGRTPAFSAVTILIHVKQLVWIWSSQTDRDRAFYSLPDFVETQRSVSKLDGMGADANWGASLTGTEPNELLS